MQKGKPAKWRREISSVARAIRPSLSWAVPFRVGSVARCVTKCLFNLDQLCTRYVPFATRSDKRPRYAILRIRVSNRPSLNDTLKSIAKNIVRKKKNNLDKKATDPVIIFYSLSTLRFTTIFSSSFR